MKEGIALASQAARAGWKFSAFCEAVGLSRSYIYMLPEDRRPHSVKLGKRRVIVEAPSDWLQRIGAAQ
jgi:predicted DNA-binding transcriptional regulator AlpA